MPSLNGRRIALLESRLRKEISTLVTRLGGVALNAPAVREVPRVDDVDAFLEAVTAGRLSVAVFQTGAGVAALFRESGLRGQLDLVIERLREISIVSRGPKPMAVLTRYGLTPTVVSAKPHTTRELLEALPAVDIQDRDLLLVHYGERNDILADALLARGARVTEVCPYVWALPEDVSPITAVIRDAVERRVDAMLFTSQIQCRHLFELAGNLGLAESLKDSLNGDIVVGAVGPVSAAALRQLGVIPDVMPAAPNMASLVTAVSDYFELTRKAGPPRERL